MSEQFKFGSVTLTLDDLSESDEYLRSTIDQHKALEGMDFCEACCVRTPCDYVALAASGLARSRDLAAAQAREQDLEKRLRSAHEYASIVVEQRNHAQSRADGYALLVAELRAALIRVMPESITGGVTGGVETSTCTVCWQSSRLGTEIPHESDCILAADPEVRAAELLKEREKGD